MRAENVHVRNVDESLNAVCAGFNSARKSRKCKGEHFDFESTAVLFPMPTPKRRDLIECQQVFGPVGLRALAYGPGRDLKISEVALAQETGPDMVSQIPCVYVIRGVAHG